MPPRYLPPRALRGRITSAGFASGDRFVVGVWDRSPIGPFVDVMWADPGGRRTLLAPDDRAAEFITSVYAFDAVEVGTLATTLGRRHLTVTGERLTLSLHASCAPVPVGPPRPLWVTRWVERPIARALLGVNTWGTSPTGVQEWYQATSVAWLTARSRALLDGRDLGALAPVDPPCGFGFSEPPRRPSMVRVRPTLRFPCPSAGHTARFSRVGARERAPHVASRAAKGLPPGLATRAEGPAGKMSPMEPTAMLEAERRSVAELVDGLSEDQLNSPSLCGAWRVRDVAGHVLWVATTRVPAMALAMARHRTVSVDRMLEREAISLGDLPTAELRSRLAAAASSRYLPPGIKPAGYLADTLVHHQDMRRPLGLPCVSPPEHIRAALRIYLTANFLTGGKSRTQGLRMVATDVDFAVGDGPEVRGPGEALLMAGVGRPAALDDLDGPGIDEYRSRFS